MSGMASGVDTDAIINKLVEVEAQPIKKLQKSKLVNNQKKDALKDLAKAIRIYSSFKNNAKTEKDFDNIKNTFEFRRMIGE